MVKKILNRFFIGGLTGMSYGLFATLIIGTILQQIGTLISGEIGTYLYQFGKIAAGMTSAGIGIGVACKFGESPLVVLSSATAGMVGVIQAKSLPERFSRRMVHCYFPVPEDRLALFLLLILQLKLLMLSPAKPNLTLLLPL